MSRSNAMGEVSVPIDYFVVHGNCNEYRLRMPSSGQKRKTHTDLDLPAKVFHALVILFIFQMDDELAVILSMGSSARCLICSNGCICIAVYQGR